MTKFFRQYSRFFLLLFMSVLMVVFVLGDAIGRGSSAQADLLDIKMGTAFDGTEIRNSDINRAMADLESAAQLGLVPAPFARLEVISSDPREQRIGIYLMLQEAERMGVRVAPPQLQELLGRMQVSSDFFRDLAKRYRRSSDELYRGFGRVMAAGLLFQTQVDAGLSQPLPQLEQQYRNFQQNAKVKVSVIDANAFLSDVQPTDAQLAELFEAGKERTDEVDGEEMKYGYQLPDRVKIEWITLDPSTLEDDVTIREVDAERYYRNNQDRFRLPSGTPGVPGAVQPYADVRDQVRATVRKLKAVETARKQINLIRESVVRPWNGVPLDEEGNRGPLPVDQQQDFASNIQQSQFADRIVRSETAWLTREELATLPLLGGARIQIDNRRVAAPEVAFNLVEIADEESTTPLDALHVGQPAPVLTTFDTRATGRSEPYQPIAFRVVGLKASGAPSGLDEVREKLVADWRLQQAMQQAATYAEELAEQARGVGLTQAVSEAEALRGALQAADAAAVSADGTALNVYAKRMDVVEPPRFPRFATNVSGVRSTPLHEKIYELAGDTSDHRVVAVAAPDSKAWVVAELVEVEPLYQGDFDDQRARFEGQSESLQRFRFAQLWVDFENIQARTDFVAEAIEGEEEQEETSQ